METGIGFCWKYMEREDELYRAGTTAALIEDRNIDTIAVFHSDDPEEVLLEVSIPHGARAEVFHRVTVNTRGVESDHLFVGWVRPNGEVGFFEFFDRGESPIFHEKR